ncbi:hypothetical protein [Nocardia amikacinitolerans]|uniref:hypothetical protein n=1 Tax=Nocardia amikacinitolerans TaxID=756689 RepID=UPI0020A5AD91|nr:hypothetical protein [Nocardia amikacinitolerans]MCP2290688.1 hypothetical protein [Nocardia amikacinitolerans]
MDPRQPTDPDTDKLHDLVDTAKDKAADAKHRAQDRSAAAALAATDLVDRARTQVRDAAEHGEEKLPEPVAERGRDLAAAVRERPLPFALAALAALVVLRRILRRSH